MQDETVNTGLSSDVANIVNGLMMELEKRRSPNGSSLPISVQPFPVVDDFKFESEKIAVTEIAEPYFRDYEQHFMQQLSGVSRETIDHNVSFFNNLDEAAKRKSEYRTYLRKALDELLACSPKKIMAEFQKQSLEAGWSYVSGYNKIVDELASMFPRCRAGIFSSRLKYSDVIQISDEILTTLRTCQTLMEDLQRRYNILEALQNSLQADLEHTECEKIVIAAKETFADNARYSQADEDDLAKKITSMIMQPISAIGNTAAIPTLQIQGQMQRTERIMVFFATADMFRAGWVEWQTLCKEIIEPNLKVMFELKRDFFKNQMLCLCDVASYNGYSLDGLATSLRKKFLQNE